MIHTKSSALESLKPSSKYIWHGTDYSGLNWLDTGEAPTESEIDAELLRLNNAEPMVQLRYERNKKNWISGNYTNPVSRKTIAVISPYFDQEIATIPDSNLEDLNLAVEKSQIAFPNWAKVNIRDRAEVMFQFKSILEKNMDALNI